jgi:hypothetical protein
MHLDRELTDGRVLPSIEMPKAPCTLIAGNGAMTEKLWLACAVAFGIVSNGLFFYMRSRLEALGHDVPYPFWLRDVTSVWRLYSLESRNNRLRIWPLYWHWVMAGCGAACMFVAAVTQR